ncbi:MAG: hypothetical protein GVY07_15010 [Bacteroidetes bacterium]|nr:hypothetical protein [Bacteroidota bacterium]
MVQSRSAAIKIKRGRFGLNMLRNSMIQIWVMMGDSPCGGPEMPHRWCWVCYPRKSARTIHTTLPGTVNITRIR